MNKFPGFRGFLPPLAALLLSTVLAACGGGDGGRDPVLGGPGLGAVPVVPVVLVAPTVTSVSPLSNATVAINAKILTATFSLAMNPTTLNATSFTLACPTGTPITGVVGYILATNNATLTLPAGPNLPVSTTCTATISTGAQASNGLPLAAAYSWNFVTTDAVDNTPPTVSSTINANGATDVPTNTKVGATFSEAMNSGTITPANFVLSQAGTSVPGTLAYSGVDALFTPTTALTANTLYTVTAKGGIGGVSDLAGNVMLVDYVWSWTTAATADTTAPTVTNVLPANGDINVPVGSTVKATFSEAMNPLTLNNTNFTVQGVTGSVAVSGGNTIATFVPSAPLANNTTYTATVSTAATDLAGNALAVNKVWSFTTVAAPIVPPVVNLASATPYGTFGGTAGMTNTGTLTQIGGDIGTIATATGSITGFHDSLGDVYTETGANMGAVNGKIYTCTNSTTGPTSAGSNSVSCTAATQARLDAETAYLALVAKPVLGASPAPGQNLAGLTLLPGVYKSAGGDFMIQGGDLTLDAQGDANASWVFQMATSLTVGGPGAASPQSVILAGGAQAKNVFWQVGSAATINAAGGGTMMGTIISQAGAAFSTAGNVAIVHLTGRVLSLGASVTLVNTVITVPAP